MLTISFEILFFFEKWIIFDRFCDLSASQDIIDLQWFWWWFRLWHVTPLDFGDCSQTIGVRIFTVAIIVYTRDSIYSNWRGLKIWQIGQNKNNLKANKTDYLSIYHLLILFDYKCYRRNYWKAFSQCHFSTYMYAIRSILWINV